MAVLVGFHCGVIRCELANQACGMARPKQALEAESSVCGNPVGRPDLNPRSRAVFFWYCVSGIGSYCCVVTLSPTDQEMFVQNRLGMSRETLEFLFKSELKDRSTRAS